MKMINKIFNSVIFAVTAKISFLQIHSCRNREVFHKMFKVTKNSDKADFKQIRPRTNFM